MEKKPRIGSVIELDAEAAVRASAYFGRVTQVNCDNSVFVSRRPEDGGEMYINESAYTVVRH